MYKKMPEKVIFFRYIVLQYYYTHYLNLKRLLEVLPIYTVGVTMKFQKLKTLRAPLILQVGKKFASLF